MTTVSVYDAKTHLSRLLRRVRSGDEIVIAVSGRPVARLVPFSPDDGPRVLGGDEGTVWIADDFDAPLPDDVIDPFYAARAVPAPRRPPKPSTPRRGITRAAKLPRRRAR